MTRVKLVKPRLTRIGKGEKFSSCEDDNSCSPTKSTLGLYIFFIILHTVDKPMGKTNVYQLHKSPY